MINKIEKINLYLILLIPIFLVTGPFLPDLITTISSLLILMIIFLKKKFFYLNNNIFLFFLFWCTYLVLRSIFSENIYFSLESSLFYIRFGLLSLMIVYLLDNYKNFNKLFCIFIISSFLIVIFDAYVQFLFGKNFIGFVYDNYRLSGAFGEELKLGSYISRLFPLVFALIIYNFKDYKYTGLLLGFLLVLTDIIVYLTGERTSIFFMLLSTILLILLIKDFKKIRIFSFIISLIIIIFLTINNSDLKYRIIDVTLFQTGLSTKLSENYEKESRKQLKKETRFHFFSSVHESHYITALRIFNDYKIFGIGTKLFRIKCHEKEYEYDIFSCSTHPHNTYIQLLAETGLIGTIPVFVLFLFLSFILLKKMYLNFILNKNYISDYQTSLIICLIITLWPLSPSGSFFNNWLCVIYFLPIGFLIHSFIEKNKYA